MKRYFEYRDEHEFTRFNTASNRKIAKRSNYKCRVCKQSLAGNEKLEVNYIIPRILGGKDKYENLELLHASCYQQHQVLLDKYGGGKTLTKIQKFYDDRQITSISNEGINTMKEQFKLFRYL